MPVDSSKKPKTESTNVEDLAEENIDSRVLELLGLQDVFDLDYSDYKTLLIGKLNENNLLSSKGKSIKTDDVTLLRDELLRVKKIRSGRFKVSNKTIKPNKFFSKKDIGSVNTVKKSNLLPYSNIPGAIQKLPDNEIDDTVKKESTLSVKKNDEILSIVGEIKDIVMTIADSMKQQLLEKQKLASLSSRESEKKSRERKERKLEQKPSTIGKIVENLTKPFTSIFDTIKNFLMNVLLGSLANWLFTVIQNPKILLQPIQNLLDGIFGFFNNILQFIDKKVVQPVRNFIGFLNSALNGFIGIINKAIGMIPGSNPIESPELPNIPNIPEVKSPDIVGKDLVKSESSLPNVQIKNQGGIVGGDVKINKSSQNLKLENVEKIINNNIIQKSSGGPVPKMDNSIAETGGIVSGNTGLDVTGLGQDTQLTALKKNEFVLVPGAAQAIGIPFLESMNKKYGGNNASKFSSINDIKIRTASGGGGIDLWGISPSRNTKLSSSSDFDDVPSHHRSYTTEAGIPKDYAVVRPGINPAAQPSHGRGLPVVAGVSGKVSFAGFSGNAGNMVEISNSEGKKIIRLLHLDKIKTSTGASVSPSTIIGTQGNTGTRDIHVHVDGRQSVHTNWIRAMLGGSFSSSVGGESDGGSGGSGTQPAQDQNVVSEVDYSKFATILGDKRGEIVLSKQQTSQASIISTPRSNVPPPPKAGTPQIVPLPQMGSQKPTTSGSMTGNTGTPPVVFSSVNSSEFSHYVAVKSLLNVLEY